MIIRRRYVGWEQVGGSRSENGEMQNAKKKNKGSCRKTKIGDLDVPNKIIVLAISRVSDQNFKTTDKWRYARQANVGPFNRMAYKN